MLTAAAIVTALAAVVGLFVSIVRSRQSLSEWFDEKEEYPRTRGDRWFGRISLCTWAMFMGFILTMVGQSCSAGDNDPDPPPVVNNGEETP